MYAIGIDIGTTSLCGLLLDARTGNVITKQVCPNDSGLPGREWESLQDAAALAAQAEALVQDLFCGGVRTIGVTGQMHGIVYINGEGCAVSPLYTWQDQRGAQPYRDTTYAAFLSCPPGYGSVTHFYNQVNGLVPKEAAGFCTIQDYVVMKLCGRKTPLLHTSNAASLGCFDLNTCRFTRGPMEEVTGRTEAAGTWRGIPVAVAIGDHPAAFLGAVKEEDSLLVNIGTGSQVSMIAGGAAPPAPLELRPFYEGQFLATGAALCGGRAYAVLERFYRDVVEQATGRAAGSLYEVMDRVLEEERQPSLVCDTRFCGTRQHPEIKGSIQNIGTDNLTMFELTSAVLHGMVKELFDLYQMIGCPAARLVGAGNGIRKNKALRRMLCEQFGMDMAIPTCEEEAAYGAALFSLAAGGAVNGLAQVRQLIRYEEEDK